MNTLPNLAQFSKFDFSAGSLTSHAGYLPLTTFIQKEHYLDFLEDVPFDDNRVNPAYSNSDILNSKILYNLLGVSSSSSRFQLKHDPLLEGIRLSSQSTDSRLQSRITQETIDFLSSKVTKQACQHVLNRDQNEIILDQDSTVIETFGKQQRSAYINHYKTTGYHPLLITEHHSGVILGAWLRPGNTYASLGSWEQLRPILELLQEDPDKVIRYRADSAAFDSLFLHQLEEAGVQYYIRAKNTHKLKAEVQSVLDRKGIDFQEYTASNPYMGEIEYSVNRSAPRRVVYKAYQYVDEYGQPSLFPAIYCVITNDTKASVQEVMNFYEARGTSENINKVLKDDFFAGKLSHSTMLGNALDLLLCVLSYNLYTFFSDQILEGKDQSMRMNTYRRVMGTIAAKIVHHGRQIYLNFSSRYWNRRKFEYYLCKVWAM